VSQRFLNLIRGGETAEVAASVEENPSLVESRDAQGVSAFLWSIYSRQPVIRDFLLSRLPGLDIFEAAALGDCSRLSALLDQDGELIHEISADGWTPLHLAAAFGGREATAFLLDHGAQVNQRSNNPMQNQALHACIALGRDCDTARLLIARGAELNAPQMGGYSPLHQAAAAGLPEMTRVLLGAGADPARRCDQGKTPVDYARERDHEGIVHLLALASA
jgi:uncharacterized protein